MMRTLRGRRNAARRHQDLSHRPHLESLEVRSLLSGAGSLDPTFGSGGIAVNSLPGGGSVAIQGDGKILTTASVSGGGSFSKNWGALIRFNAVGTLDTSFGSGGTAVARLSRSLGSSVNAVALQGDGKIVVAGSTDTGKTAGLDFFLARFNSNGTLDSTFGSGGLVHTDVGSTNESANALVIQPDGKLVAVGFTGVNGASEPAAVRYNANGSLDTSFGKSGKLSFLVDGPGWFNGVALQADGKIVAVGAAGAAGDDQWVIVRYTTGGVLDPSFGTGGAVREFPAGNATAATNEANGVAVQPDGKLVVTGPTISANSEVAELIRLNVEVSGQTDGSLDTTFGQGGIVTTAVAGTSDDALALALQADGKIVVAGYESGTSESSLLARYHVGVVGQTDGSLDSTFGQGGIVTTPGPGTGSLAEAVAIYPTTDLTNGGKIVATGHYSDGLMAARYFGSATTSMATATLAQPAPAKTSPAPQPAATLAGIPLTVLTDHVLADGETGTDWLLPLVHRRSVKGR